MNPAKRLPTAIVFLLAIVAWVYPWFPPALATTEVSLSRYYAALPEVNLPPSHVLAAMRSLDENSKRTAGQQLSTSEIAGSPPSLNTTQVESVQQAMTQSPPSVERDLRPLGRQAWRLLVLFIATIVLILLDAMPIFVCAIGALSLAVLTGVLTPSQGFSGFSDSTIILIVVAFAIARGVDKSGLGKRIAFLIIRRFGSSSLGLAYSMAATDALIAPAFASNTARSGVLFPVVMSVAHQAGSSPQDGTRTKLGAFLMMNSIAGLSISSSLWLTAMAANPMGVKLAHGIDRNLNITFGSWFAAASLPSLIALMAVPYLLYRAFPPDVTKTPDAPRAARKELSEMGPPSRDEQIMAVVFVALIAGWALSKVLGVHNTAIALGGLFILLATNFFSAITPQASSANAIFIGSEYLTPREVYMYGGFVTVLNTLIYGVFGTAWIWFLVKFF